MRGHEWAPCWKAQGKSLESNLILIQRSGNLSHDQNHEYVSHFQPCGFVAQLMLASN